MDYLSSSVVMEHVRALADVIGPRPAGHRAEMLARQYIRHALSDAGVTAEIEEIPFETHDTWGYAMFAAVALVFGGSWIGRRSRLLGSAVSLFGAYNAYAPGGNRRQWLQTLYPKRQSADLIVRFPASSGIARQKVVFIAHTDTNKHRLTFTPELKASLRPLITTSIVMAAANGLAQLLGLNLLRRLTAWYMAATLPLILLDEAGGYIDGANNNASAVACLLGLAGYLARNPMPNTEVWLAFTGAEEVGSLGMHALLDKHRETLANAWFIDFEMVGSGDIVYVTEHSGLSHFNSYAPDAESLQIASETANRHPDLNVRGTPMIMTEEIGALRSRGFRGICIAGVGSDGWLANWHQYSDNSANIQPECIEKAARFALAMLHTIDERR